MTRTLACSTALALVFSAQAALAVTPEEVWDSWQALVTSAGQELTADTAVRNGDTLEVSYVVVTQEDELGGSSLVAIDRMDFTDNGDGTVLVTMSDEHLIQLVFPEGVEGPSTIKLSVNQPGMVITAGGSATETSYEVSAPTTTVTLLEILDQEGETLDTQVEMVLADLSASYLVTRDGDDAKLDSSFAASRLTVDVAGTDKEGTGGGTMTLSIAGLEGATKGNFLGAEIMANMATALNGGFATDSTFSFGALSAELDVTDGSGPVQASVAATGGGFAVALDKAKLDYGTSLTGLEMTVSGAEIPFPEVKVGLSEFGFGMMMPVTKSETPQDFGFTTRFVDFTVSEDIWGLIDPGTLLSRDPASLVIDIKGKGLWYEDIMDPSFDLEQVEAPGELHSLDLTEVLVKAAGAQVAATGALTIDNSKVDGFTGMPEPTGKIDVTITGVNKLVDNLIALGLLPSEEAMGFRMMLGLFTRPGGAPDVVTSAIEFRDGGIFANGMPLQ